MQGRVETRRETEPLRIWRRKASLIVVAEEPPVGVLIHMGLEWWTGQQLVPKEETLQVGKMLPAGTWHRKAYSTLMAQINQFD